MTPVTMATDAAERIDVLMKAILAPHASEKYAPAKYRE